MILILALGSHYASASAIHFDLRQFTGRTGLNDLVEMPEREPAAGHMGVHLRYVERQYRSRARPCASICAS